jgi:oxygen-independent coproporphyrinogen-3 oxidase
MSVRLAEKYDVRVPRYTSYPTAPHFAEDVAGAVYTTWLEGLDPDLDLSLYFHIPFCAAMCWFCGCYTKIVERYAPIRTYLDALFAEIDLVADTLPGRFTARHLHWGGGSPTMLEDDDWLATFERLRAGFDLAPNAEIAVEMDPRTATESYVATLARAGVNRASIGVQDFHPQVQAAINRAQPFDVIERVVGWLRGHGIDGLNMDLMYGLPHQTTERVVDMVDLAARLGPARVALFGYAHVPWMKSHMKMIDETTLPGTTARWEQFAAASARLVELGYVAIGLDHFALPGDSLATALADGHLHRNFQGYTSDTAPAMIGFGASAIGDLPNGYVQNAAPLKTYMDAVRDGRLAVARGFALGADDRLRRTVIERIMCDLEADVGTICADLGASADALAADMERLAPLVEDGVCRIDDGRVQLTDAGRPLVRLVAAAFDSYLDHQAERHSRAV